MRLRPSAAHHTHHPFKPRPSLWNPMLLSKTTNTVISTDCMLSSPEIWSHYSFQFFNSLSLSYLQFLSLGLTLKILNMSWKLEWAPTRKRAITALSNPMFPPKKYLHIPAEVCACFGDDEALTRHSNHSVHECIFLFCLKWMVLWESLQVQLQPAVPEGTSRGLKLGFIPVWGWYDFFVFEISLLCSS